MEKDPPIGIKEILNSNLFTFFNFGPDLIFLMDESIHQIIIRTINRYYFKLRSALTPSHINFLNAVTHFVCLSSGTSRRTPPVHITPWARPTLPALPVNYRRSNGDSYLGQIKVSPLERKLDETTACRKYARGACRVFRT